MLFLQTCPYLSKISFLSRFPLGPTQTGLLDEWIKNMRRANWKPCASSRICGDHFADDCYELDEDGEKTNNLKKDAIPSDFRFPEHLMKKETPRRSPRK